MKKRIRTVGSISNNKRRGAYETRGHSCAAAAAFGSGVCSKRAAELQLCLYWHRSRDHPSRPVQPGNLRQYGSSKLRVGSSPAATVNGSFDRMSDRKSSGDHLEWRLKRNHVQYELHP